MPREHRAGKRGARRQANRRAAQVDLRPEQRERLLRPDRFGRRQLRYSIVRPFTPPRAFTYRKYAAAPFVNPDGGPTPPITIGTRRADRGRHQHERNEPQQPPHRTSVNSPPRRRRRREHLPAPVLRVADPEHDDPEPRRLRADLPDLGGGPLRGRLHGPGGRLLRGTGEGRLRADHHRRHDHPQGSALLRVQLPRPVGGRAGRRPREGRGRRPPARVQARLPAPARRPARDSGAEEGPGLRLRCRVVHGRAEPDPARRVPERADAEGARGARDRRDPGCLRVVCAAGGRGRARRRRVPHVARLPALAVPLAALQPPSGPLGRLVREPAALPARGDDADPGGDRRRAVPRLPDQLDLVLARRPRAGGREADRRRPRAAGGRRLRQPLRRRPPLVHPHADDLRARLGARLHEGGQGGLVEAGAAGRPDHAPEDRRGDPRCGRGRRDPARAAAVRRRRVGGQGA